MNICALPVFNGNWLSKRMAKNMHTPSARLQYHHPLVSPRSPQVSGGEANESWRIQSWPDVRVPPLLVVSPLTEWAIWAAESQPQAHPSWCPALWARSQRDSLGELAGISARHPLAKLEHVLMILAFSGVKKCAWFTLFNAIGWFQPRSLTGRRCIPTVVLMS